MSRRCVYEDNDIEDLSLAQLHALLKLANKDKERVDGQVDNTSVDTGATISKNTEEEAAEALSNLMTLSPVEPLNIPQCQTTLPSEEEEEHDTDSRSEEEDIMEVITKSEKKQPSDHLKQSKIKESVSEDMVQYLNTLDKIVENVCEEMDDIEYKRFGRRMSQYYPIHKEDPDYGEKVRVYRMKIKEMKKIWIPPVTKDNSGSSENTEEDLTENKRDIDVDACDLSNSNSEEYDYKGSDNESGNRDSEWRLRNAYASAGISTTPSRMTRRRAEKEGIVVETFGHSYLRDKK